MKLVTLNRCSLNWKIYSILPSRRRSKAKATCKNKQSKSATGTSNEYASIYLLQRHKAQVARRTINNKRVIGYH
jgi:hypothetical protein